MVRPKRRRVLDLNSGALNIILYPLSWANEFQYVLGEGTSRNRTDRENAMGNGDDCAFEPVDVWTALEELCLGNGEKRTEIFRFSDFRRVLIERFKFRAAAPARSCTFSHRPVPIDRRRTASLRTPSGRHGGGYRLFGACVHTTACRDRDFSSRFAGVNSNASDALTLVAG